MGQAQSKRLSNTSTTPLTLNADTNPPGDDITSPAPPRPIYRLSELFDPVDLVREESQALSEPSPHLPSTTHVPRRPLVQSPSGQILDAEHFAGHAHRPLSVRERQEEIVRRTRAAVERAETPGGDGTFAIGQDGHAERTAESQTASTEQAKKQKKRRGCCSCC